MITHDWPLKAFGLQSIHLSSYLMKIHSCGENFNDPRQDLAPAGFLESGRGGVAA